LLRSLIVLLPVAFDTAGHNIVPTGCGSWTFPHTTWYDMIQRQFIIAYMLTTILTCEVVTLEYVKLGEVYFTESMFDMMGIDNNGWHRILTVHRVSDPNIIVFYYAGGRHFTSTETE